MERTHEIEKADVRIDDMENLTIATITYKGKNYVGDAYCMEEDRPYRAKLFGARLAHERAILRFYAEQRREAKKKYLKYSARIFKDNFYSSPDIINYQYLELKKLYDEFTKYQQLEHKQYKIIAAGIKAQTKSVETIKKIRNKDKLN